ncbi:MAG: hypothetical protein ACXVDA_26645, partial [Ktedonobacterales bacterium]
MKTFGEQFIESKGAPLAFDGMKVEMIYLREVNATTHVRLEFFSANELVTQGVSAKLDSGSLVVAGQEAKDIGLWRNTAPDVVEIECRPRKKTAVFKLWNTWRGRDGITQAWIGNAGMVIEETPDGATIRASDGVGEPCFDDL